MQLLIIGMNCRLFKMGRIVAWDELSVAGSRLRWELLHHQLQLFSRPPRYSANKLEERTMCPVVMTGQKLQTEFVIFLRHVYYSISSFDSLIYKILCKLLIGNTIWLVENYEVDFDTSMHVNTVCLMY